jgi:hypothetical protein
VCFGSVVVEGFRGGGGDGPEQVVGKVTIDTAPGTGTGTALDPGYT